MRMKTSLLIKPLLCKSTIPVLILIFSLTACRSKSVENLETPPKELAGSVEKVLLSDGSSFYFPRLPSLDGALMEALVEGLLTLRDGCLRIGTQGYEEPGFLVLWPAQISFRILDTGVIEVPDESQHVIGRSGETIRLGGGAIESQDAMKYWEAMINGMPIDHCPGPYWGAGALSPLPVDGQ